MPSLILAKSTDKVQRIITSYAKDCCMIKCVKLLWDWCIVMLCDSLLMERCALQSHSIWIELHWSQEFFFMLLCSIWQCLCRSIFLFVSSPPFFFLVTTPQFINCMNLKNACQMLVFFFSLSKMMKNVALLFKCTQRPWTFLGE